MPSCRVSGRRPRPCPRLRPWAGRAGDLTSSFGKPLHASGRGDGQLAVTFPGTKSWRNWAGAEWASCSRPGRSLWGGLWPSRRIFPAVAIQARTAAAVPPGGQGHGPPATPQHCSDPRNPQQGECPFLVMEYVEGRTFRPGWPENRCLPARRPIWWPCWPARCMRPMSMASSIAI